MSGLRTGSDGPSGEVDSAASSSLRFRQNEQMAETLDLLVEQSGARFETVGSMRKDRSVFVTMKLPTAASHRGPNVAPTGRLREARLAVCPPTR